LYKAGRKNNDYLSTDEHSSILVDTQWIGGILISPYRYSNVFYITINQMHGYILEEEIIMV
jgi:hypothetical protein